MGQAYSQAAQDELRQIYQMDMDLLDKTMKLFRGQRPTPESWLDMKLQERTITKLAVKAQSNHMERLQEKTCTFEQGLTFVESLNSLTRIVNHVMNIAEASGSELLLNTAKE